MVGVDEQGHRIITFEVAVAGGDGCGDPAEIWIEAPKCHVEGLRGIADQDLGSEGRGHAELGFELHEVVDCLGRRPYCVVENAVDDGVLGEQGSFDARFRRIPDRSRDCDC